MNFLVDLINAYLQFASSVTHYVYVEHWVELVLLCCVCVMWRVIRPWRIFVAAWLHSLTEE